MILPWRLATIQRCAAASRIAYVAGRTFSRFAPQNQLTKSSRPEALATLTS